MKKVLCVYLLIHVCSVFAGPAGKIIFTKNNVSIKREGAVTQARRGTPFFVGDTILTAASAQAQIRYDNGTLVSLQPESVYQINSYTPEKSPQSNATLSSGGLESATQGQKKAALQTPVIALAISGTSYRVMIKGKDQSAKVATQVFRGQVKLGDFPLGPRDKYCSATYDGLTKTITPGPVLWSTWGWVPIPFILLTPDVSLSTTNVVGEVVPSNVVNNSVTSSAAAEAVAIPTLTPFNTM